MNKIKAIWFMNFKLSKVNLLMVLLCSIPVIIIITVFSFVSFISYSSLVTTRSSDGEVISSAVNSHNYSASSYVGIIYVLMMSCFLIIGIANAKGAFSYSIRMGSTRRNYFWGSLTFYMAIAAAFSLFHTFLIILENILLRYAGANQLNNFSFIYDKISPLGAIRLTIYCFLIFMVILSVANTLSHLAFWFGQYGWLFIIIGSIAFIYGVVPRFMFFFNGISRTDFNINIIDLTIILVAFTINYFVISKTELKNA